MQTPNTLTMTPRARGPPPHQQEKTSSSKIQRNPTTLRGGANPPFTISRRHQYENTTPEDA